MVLAEKLNVQIGDSLSSLSDTSTDSSEFVLSSESSCLVRYRSFIYGCEKSSLRCDLV